MKVRINKLLKRTDGSNLASGSIAECLNPRLLIGEKTVVMPFRLFASLDALESLKEPVTNAEGLIVNQLVKVCNEEEWEILKGSSISAINEFFKNCVNEVLEVDNSEVV